MVARNVARDWDRYGNCGLVVGATYPQELVEVRKIALETFLLVPGVGAQGGDLESAVSAAYSPDPAGDFVINVSSAILYAYRSDQFKTEPERYAQAAAAAAEYYDTQIRQVLRQIE